MDELPERALRRQYDQVYRYVRRRTRDPQDAADITQEVFAAAAGELERLAAAETPLLAWLYTVARRRLADEARRAARRPRQEPVPLELAATPPSEYGARVARALAVAVADLPPAQREVVVLKLLDGRPFAEIARRVGTTEAAAKMRFVRGLESLREGLRREGIEP